MWHSVLPEYWVYSLSRVAFGAAKPKAGGSVELPHFMTNSNRIQFVTLQGKSQFQNSRSQQNLHWVEICFQSYWSSGWAYPSRWPTHRHGSVLTCTLQPEHARMPVTSPSANSLLWPLKFLWNYESPCSHSSVLAEDVAGFSQLDWFFLQCQRALWQASANWINTLGVSPGLPHRQTRTWPLTAFFPNAGQAKETNEGVGVRLYLDWPVAHRQNPALPPSPFWNACGLLIIPYKTKSTREFATFPLILLQRPSEKVKQNQTKEK